MKDKLFKALDEVVAWFKKEEKMAADEVHAALAALHLAHGPAPQPEAPAATTETTSEGAAK